MATFVSVTEGLEIFCPLLATRGAAAGVTADLRNLPRVVFALLIQGSTLRTLLGNGRIGAGWWDQRDREWMKPLLVHCYG